MVKRTGEDEERPDLIGAFYVDVIGCARCGGIHRHWLFKRFVQPPEGYTHYGICPKYDEPILMTQTPETK